HNSAEQQALEPGKPEQQAGDRAGEGGGNDDPDRGQEACRQQAAAEDIEPSPQATVEQNDRQRDGADHVGQTIIVEDDAAGAVLPGQHADDEEDQQQGGAETCGDEARGDADENQEG